MCSVLIARLAHIIHAHTNKIIDIFMPDRGGRCNAPNLKRLPGQRSATDGEPGRGAFVGGCQCSVANIWLGICSGSVSIDLFIAIQIIQVAVIIHLLGGPFNSAAHVVWWLCRPSHANIPSQASHISSRIET